MHSWTEQNHATVVPGTVDGFANGTRLEVATPDADGNRWEVVVGTRRSLCIVVASYTTGPAPDVLGALGVAAAQAGRVA